MSTSLGQELMSIIIQYKGIFIAVIILTIGKKYNNKYILFSSNDKKNSFYEFI